MVKVRLLVGVLLVCCFNASADSTAMSVASTTQASQPTEKYSTSGMNEVAGRVLILFTHPHIPQKLWAGTVHGGLWHSADAGISWLPASELMKNMTVNALAVDPRNPDWMYAGTGLGRSKQLGLRGQGMFKSVDGGASWHLLALTSPATVGERWRYINSIAVSAEGIVLAATSDDNYNGFIFRSKDGGQSWGLVPVYAGSKVGPRNMVHRVRFDPDNPDVALFMDDYANVTHSSDGGLTWRVVKKSSTNCK